MSRGRIWVEVRHRRTETVLDVVAVDTVAELEALWDVTLPGGRVVKVLSHGVNRRSSPPLGYVWVEL